MWLFTKPSLVRHKALSIEHPERIKHTTNELLV